MQFVASLPSLTFTSQEVFLAVGNKRAEIFEVIHLLELCAIPRKDEAGYSFPLIDIYSVFLAFRKRPTLAGASSKDDRR